MNIVDLYLRANEKYTKLNQDESVIKDCFTKIEQALTSYDGTQTKLRVSFNIPEGFNPMEISNKVLNKLRDQLIPVNFVVASKNYFELDFIFSQIIPEVLHVTPTLPIQDIVDFCQDSCIVRSLTRHIVENVSTAVCSLSLPGGENLIVKLGDYIIKERFKGITVRSNCPRGIIHEIRNHSYRWNS